jgi:hypothetical protein
MMESSVFVVAQIALLVLYYGGILPSLPLWLVWLPALLYAGALIGVVILAIIAYIIMWYW